MYVLTRWALRVQPEIEIDAARYAALKDALQVQLVGLEILRTGVEYWAAAASRLLRALSNESDEIYKTHSKTKSKLCDIQIDAKQTLGPKPIQFRKCERSVDIFDVVSNVENETAVVAAIQRSPQTPANHLEIEIRAVDRPRHDDGTGLGCVGAFAEYTVVDKRPDLAATELFNHAAASRRFSLSTDSA